MGNDNPMPEGTDLPEKLSTPELRREYWNLSVEHGGDSQVIGWIFCETFLR